MIGISDKTIHETPIAVIDFETTGISAGTDRVIEASVVRVDPGCEPRLVFDTLINPKRRVSATEIHGITDEDVADAPCFDEIAGDLLEAIEGCVITAYNVYFDMRFLNFEMRNAGVEHEAPHFCLMYMRPMLGLGSRCKLPDACSHHGIKYDATHIAADDALASGRLLACYLDELKAKQVRTYDDLSRLRTYKFQKSFSNNPFPHPKELNLAVTQRLKPRSGTLLSPSVGPTRIAVREYWDALKTVLADLKITDEDVAYIKGERRRLDLPKEKIRVLHARAFASAILQFCDDEWLDDKELRKLRRLHKCLDSLGWAPGN